MSSPIFSCVPFDINLSRVHGSIVSHCTTNKYIFIGTSTAYLLIINIDTGDSVCEVQFSELQRTDNINHIYVHTNTLNTIVQTDNELIYHVSNKWLINNNTTIKPVLLNQLNAIHVTSIAYLAHTLANCTRFICGNSNGDIYDVLFDNDKYSIIYCTKLHSIAQSNRINDICILHSTQDTLHITAATNQQQYHWINVWQQLSAAVSNLIIFFEPFNNLSMTPIIIDSPAHDTTAASKHTAHMRVYDNIVDDSADDIDSTCIIGWSSDSGIYFTDSPINNFYSIRCKMLQYTHIHIIDFAVTEFHFVILYSDRVCAVNRLNNKQVFEHTFDINETGQLIGISTDNTTTVTGLFIYASYTIHELIVADESCNIWQLYCDKFDFVRALERCSNDIARDVVYQRQAEYLIENNDVDTAATVLAKSKQSFEQITLKLLRLQSSNKSHHPLRIYLLHKLQQLNIDQTTQLTMISTWVCELYCYEMSQLTSPGNNDFTNVDSIGSPLQARIRPLTALRVMSESDNIDTETEHRQRLYATVQQELYKFIDKYQTNLHANTTIDLIQQYGLNDVLLYYCTLIGDYNVLLIHYVQHKLYKQCIDVLTQIEDAVKYAELFYRYTPILIHVLPQATIQLLQRAITHHVPVHKLLPAFIVYVNDIINSNKTQHFDQYLLPLIDVIQLGITLTNNTDTTLHNYLVLIYTHLHQDGQTKLIAYIQQQSSAATHSYTYSYVKQLCEQHQFHHALYELYCSHNDYIQAIQIALSYDIELAKSTIQRIQNSTNTILIKQLWLMVAQHLIATAHSNDSTQLIIDLIKQSNFTLPIEDILPLMSEFDHIDNVKTLVVESIGRLYDKLELLENDMSRYSDVNTNIRSDINALTSSHITINPQQPCDICKTILISKPFVMYMCQHAYHTQCVLRHPLLSRMDQHKIDINELECIRCGKLMIESIDTELTQITDTDDWNI